MNLKINSCVVFTLFSIMLLIQAAHAAEPLPADTASSDTASADTASAAPAPAEPVPAEPKSPCAECHEEIPKTMELLSLSPHADLDCSDCHADASDLPHPEKMDAVSCADCHDEVAEIYTIHGRGKLSDPDVPSCTDCHGTHDILPASDERSRVHSKNLLNTCGHCHQNKALIAKHDLWFDDAVETYKESVHGHATADGSRPEAATCNDCHSTGGTAHRILSPADPTSSINHFNIPNTCGKCHPGTAEDYWKSIHGKLAARGETDAPICTDCHGEHGILSPSDVRSPVNAARLAEATCAPCHESARLNEKFDIPTGRLKSFIDTYHGLKSKAGDVTVANCASCHGHHDILPHTDPESSIHADNLRETCSKCHPDIHESIAAGAIHAGPTATRTYAAHVVSLIYIGLIILVIGGMLLYVIIDLRRYFTEHLTHVTQVRRMTNNAVWQHTLLMVSFSVLAITGFALRFSDAWWVQILFGREGGFPLRGMIHRIAAGVFLITTFWHFFYMFTKSGRRFVRDIFPNIQDAKDALAMFAYNLRFSKKHPRFGRFNFGEKAEYWALVWGTVVMSATGALLMFDNIAADLLPKGILDVMLVIHYYEAWLAVLAVLVWHLYGTVFNPAVYPMNPSWITGKMPLYMHAKEHPDDTEAPIYGEVSETDDEPH